MKGFNEVLCHWQTPSEPFVECSRTCLCWARHWLSKNVSNSGQATAIGVVISYPWCNTHLTGRELCATYFSLSSLHRQDWAETPPVPNRFKLWQQNRQLPFDSCPFHWNQFFQLFPFDSFWKNKGYRKNVFFGVPSTYHGIYNEIYYYTRLFRW